MTRGSRYFTVLFVTGLLSSQAIAQNVSLTASPNPTVLGQTVSMMATVPGFSAGKVTFYDGVNVLGSSAINGTSAVFSTSQLGPGPHALKAYFNGQMSNAVVTTVSAQSGGAFVPEVNRVPVSSPFLLQLVVSADLNNDGKPDLVGTISNGNSNGPNTLYVYLNNGSGTFASGVPYLGGKTANAVAFGGFQSGWKCRYGGDNPRGPLYIERPRRRNVPFEFSCVGAD